MPVYTNINGASREVAKKYANINGAQKEIKFCFANINGELKKYFGPDALTQRSSTEWAVGGIGVMGYHTDLSEYSRYYLLDSFDFDHTIGGDYNANRNRYTIQIDGIKAGDVVSFIGSDRYTSMYDSTVPYVTTPPATTSIDVYNNGNGTIKKWNSYGTSKQYSFTAVNTEPLMIVLTDGSGHDFAERGWWEGQKVNSMYVGFIMENLTINDRLIPFSEIINI